MLSQGVDGFRTRRNSMSLANAAFNPSGRYLWDEKAETLEAQVLMPFEDRLEMDLALPEVLDRIEERAFYEPLFVDAFGDGAVTEERVAAALAQFVRAMVSADARYDEGRAAVAGPADDFPNFTEQENEGKRLFLTPRQAGGAGCASCHATELQIGGLGGLKNNGLDPPLARAPADDLGAFEPTGEPELAGSFRVPSLRNVEVTGPYMHDGRLVTLEQVIEHYSQGVQPHEFLSPELRDDNGQPIRRPFTRDQSAALLAFLRTLTDPGFLSDPRFAEPFRSG
ncbi:MAG: cytochrome c peroxidase [Actinomycetota bacterium]